MSRLHLSTPLLVAVLLWPSHVTAQQDQGTIAGLVTDVTGAVMPGVTVKASAIETGVSVQTVTNSEGLYTVAALLIGRYRITAELPGFKRHVSDIVEVHAQSRVRVDFELELGSLDQEVSVSASAPLLDTESSSLAHVVHEEQIRDLPLNGRNFQQLAVLAAGVLPAFGHADRAGGFNSHGQWATQNNFILDGVDNNSQVFGLQDGKAQVVIPNLDAVQEFEIQTANYSAEFGRSAGAVMNVSLKSGTNQVRGTVYEFLRHDIFDARDAFSYHDRTGDGKADPDALRHNQYGSTIGGPIRRNRTFYFLSVEATRIHATESSLVTVPTLLERQGIFDPQRVIIDPATGKPFPANSIPRERWDPVAAQLLSLWPEPNFAGTTRANLISTPKYTRDRYQYDVRADHSLSVTDRAFVRVSRLAFQRERQGPLPPPAVGAADNDVSRDENDGLNLAASETHMFGSTLVNEARFGFNSLTTDKRPLTDGFPNERFGLRVSSPEPVAGLARVTFDGGEIGYVPLGESPFNPNDKVARTFQLLDNLSIVTGRHTIKLGGDLRWIQSDIIGAPQTRGVFNFNGKFTGSSLGDFLLGMTNTRAFSTFQQGALRERDYMFYLQDDWRVASRMTINLGLRYELASPMFDSEDRMTTLDISNFAAVRVVRAGERGRSWSDRALVQTDTNNWAPRVGFAFQPASRWTVRAAGGMFYGTPKAQAANLRLINNWPYYRDVTQQSTPTSSAGQLADGIDASVLGSATEMPDNLNWNVWASDFKLPTIYQWNLNLQRQLGRSLAVTTAYVGSSSNYLPRWYNINGADPGDPRTERQRRPIPRLGAITYRETSGRASYHGLEATLDKRLSRGVQFSLAYTWSHSIDDVTEQFGAEGLVIQDKRNLHADNGNSGFDRRHRLVGSYLIELPFGAGRRWLREGGFPSAVLAGWLLSGIVSMQSGAYFDVSIPNPRGRLGVTASNWRPDLIGDARLSNPGADRWLSPTAFAVPQNPDGTYRFGTLGRNSLVGPRYFNLDAGVTRDFPLGARRRLQVRWEVFNATNHPSYGLPNAILGDPDFGTIRTTLSTPRQMQFGVKLIF
jgi:hypothetical protein